MTSSASAAFSLLAALAVFLTGVVVHALCRRAGFSRELALTGLLLYFTVSFAAKNSLHDACGADPLALLAVTLAIYLTLARRDALLALVLVAGVLVKESTLFVAPLVYTLRARRLVDWPALGPALLVGAPAVLALVAVRLAVPAWNDDPRYLAGLPDSLRLVHLGQSAYGCLTALKQMIPHRLSTLSGETLLSLTCWPFGLAVTLLPLFAVRRVAVTALRYAPYLALVYAQLLFASNTERLLAFAFPPLILLALDGAETIRERLRLSASSLLLLPAALIPLHLLAPGRIDLPLKDQALLFCVAFAFLFQRRERPVTAPVVEAARVARQPGISPLRAARESFPELVQDH